MSDLLSKIWHKNKASYIFNITIKCPSCNYTNGSHDKRMLLKRNLDVTCSKCYCEFSLCANTEEKERTKHMVSQYEKYIKYTEELSRIDDEFTKYMYSKEEKQEAN